MGFLSVAIATNIVYHVYSYGIFVIAAAAAESSGYMSCKVQPHNQIVWPSY